MFVLLRLSIQHSGADFFHHRPGADQRPDTKTGWLGAGIGGVDLLDGQFAVQSGRGNFPICADTGQLELASRCHLNYEFRPTQAGAGQRMVRGNYFGNGRARRCRRGFFLQPCDAFILSRLPVSSPHGAELPRLWHDTRTLCPVARKVLHHASLQLVVGFYIGSFDGSHIVVWME